MNRARGVQCDDNYRQELLSRGKSTLSIDLFPESELGDSFTVGVEARSLGPVKQVECDLERGVVSRNVKVERWIQRRRKW